jgi:predicted enzyme related to lactoylglutathione lyase
MSAVPHRELWQALRIQDEEGSMRVTGITANLAVADIATANDFYREYLGLSVEAMNLGWVARYATADGQASVQLVTGDASAPQDSVISVHVGPDVDEAYAEARRLRYEIVDGNIINIVSHSDE